MLFLTLPLAAGAGLVNGGGGMSLQSRALAGQFSKVITMTKPRTQAPHPALALYPWPEDVP